MSLSATVRGQTQGALVEKVKAIFEGKENTKLADVWYSKGGTTEDLDAFAGWVEKNKHKKLDVAVQILALDQHKADGFPYPIGGRARIALAEVTHWVYVSGSGVGSTGLKFTFEFHFGCALIDGKWQLVGSKFADDRDKKQ